VGSITIAMVTKNKIISKICRIKLEGRLSGSDVDANIKSRENKVPNANIKITNKIDSRIGSQSSL
jgi:hypothetical protein